MKELLAVNGNLLYADNKEGEKEKVYEVIILVSESKYQLTNNYDVAKGREVSELRFFVRDSYLDDLTEQILELRKLGGQVDSSKR